LSFHSGSRRSSKYSGPWFVTLTPSHLHYRLLTLQS
jgi:hypothetical protein